MDHVVSSSTALQKDAMARPTLLSTDSDIAHMNGKVPLAQFIRPDLNIATKSKSRSQTLSETMSPSCLPIMVSPPAEEGPSGSSGKHITHYHSRDEEHIINKKVSRSGSIAKVARILGESKATIIRQKAHLPAQQNIHKGFPGNANRARQPRDRSQLPELGSTSVTSTSTPHRTRTRTRSAPASSTRTSLVGNENRPEESRRSTFPDTTPSVAGPSVPNSASTPTTPPSGRESRRSSVAKLVLDKARSVKRRLTDRRKSAEPDSPVIEEKLKGGDVLFKDRRGFSLDLPLHVSQDKSEMEYIQRKNSKLWTLDPGYCYI